MMKEEGQGGRRNDQTKLWLTTQFLNFEKFLLIYNLKTSLTVTSCVMKNNPNPRDVNASSTFVIIFSMLKVLINYSVIQ
ncbi:hypothetical protein M408DRAFT_325876 [Serendipita vermifera MAFF 305830]|uniref:Uncharacterized protein n=1 Tax=Serendipita vermifera MAFF 305830 TaxID=933852 RepID=A0A0C3BSW6_SERVB|nr:hypothetical protein M408DRAFT_325876 [Serendipita vermifera MAFF 305830]